MAPAAAWAAWVAWAARCDVGAPLSHTPTDTSPSFCRPYDAPQPADAHSRDTDARRPRRRGRVTVSLGSRYRCCRTRQQHARKQLRYTLSVPDWGDDVERFRHQPDQEENQYAEKERPPDGVHLGVVPRLEWLPESSVDDPDGFGGRLRRRRLGVAHAGPYAADRDKHRLSDYSMWIAGRKGTAPPARSPGSGGSSSSAYTSTVASNSRSRKGTAAS